MIIDCRTYEIKVGQMNDLKRTRSWSRQSSST